MSKTCESCPINDRNISDGTIIRCFVVFAGNPQKLDKLIAEELRGYESDEARASQDTRMVQMVNSRAIAACYVNRVITGTCETSPLHEFVNADFVEQGFLAF